ncbi:MAG TPA: hypothetical protein VGM98_10435, partial [Schlesneria sp.]
MTTLTKTCLAMVATAGLVAAGVSISYAFDDPQQVNDQTGVDLKTGFARPFPADQDKAGAATVAPQLPPSKTGGAIVIGAPPEHAAGSDRAAISPKALPQIWDRKLRSPLVKKTEAALEQPTEVSFT